MQHLSQNFCKGELPKNGIVNIFNVKSPNVFLRPTNLRQGQKKAKWNFLGQPTENKAIFLKFGLKKVNLATLTKSYNAISDKMPTGHATSLQKQWLGPLLISLQQLYKAS